MNNLEIIQSWIEKQKRVYLKPGEKPPAGVQVGRGKRGGSYYIEKPKEAPKREGIRPEKEIEPKPVRREEAPFVEKVTSKTISEIKQESDYPEAADRYLHFLENYAKLASEKLPDEEIAEIFNQTKQSVDKAMNYYKQHYNLVVRNLGKEEKEFYRTEIRPAIREIQDEFNEAKTRIDKVLVIDKLAHLAHVQEIWSPIVFGVLDYNDPAVFEGAKVLDSLASEESKMEKSFQEIRKQNRQINEEGMITSYLSKVEKFLKQAREPSYFETNILPADDELLRARAEAMSIVEDTLGKKFSALWHGVSGENKNDFLDLVAGYMAIADPDHPASDNLVSRTFELLRSYIPALPSESNRVNKVLAIDEFMAKIHGGDLPIEATFGVRGAGVMTNSILDALASENLDLAGGHAREDRLLLSLAPLSSGEVFTPTAGNIRERRKIIDALNKGLEIICKADNRFIIGGYASVEIVDQEKNRIPIPALRTALKDFMRDARYRNINLVHSNIQVGTVMDKFVAPDGHIYKTMVDDLGLYVVAEIRDDIQIARQVKKMILDGELRSFSISGSVLEKMPRYEKGKTFWDITKLELYEITLCRQGVNQLAKFDVLYAG
jgi:hypothetical protein